MTLGLLVATPALAAPGTANGGTAGRPVERIDGEQKPLPAPGREGSGAEPAPSRPQRERDHAERAPSPPHDREEEPRRRHWDRGGFGWRW